MIRRIIAAAGLLCAAGTPVAHSLPTDGDVAEVRSAFNRHWLAYATVQALQAASGCHLTQSARTVSAAYPPQ